MFTSAQLYALNRHDVIPARPVRKAIFSLRLWRPARQRLHSQKSQRRLLRTPDPGRRPFCTSARASGSGLAIGCVNARSVGDKAATLCRTIADERLDVFAVTETWHEDSQSLTRVTPPGYRCIDAARPISSDAAVNAVEFQNHGGLAFIYRDAIRFEKRTLDICVSTFEYLYGCATTGDGHVVLLGVAWQPTAVRGIL